ncbi:MAG: metalloregulator ArsR/SmtB family transcription factor [Gemmataceae bacterium]|nr:metalloregulator ArsR/SmtB family transcription factor [Gemmata sp.]MDW8196905.1 metalloregulator ArsR/SmtB family transcription factor [Gemmataceae bacterium]
MMNNEQPLTCSHTHSASPVLPVVDPESLERAARLFRALGDGPRLRILHLLLRGETCVSEIVTATADKFSTISQRLRILRSEGLVRRRRDGSHVYYALADDHVKDLLRNALAHARELDSPTISQLPSEDD